MNRTILTLAAACLITFLIVGQRVPNRIFWNTMEVTVTAYNSTRRQTDGTPNLAAWSNRLTPGEKSIAVSRDLIPLGLGDRAEVYIEGFDGPYLVLDKMNKRYTRRIDIYFGEDVRAARDFGKQTARIYWR